MPGIRQGAQKIVLAEINKVQKDLLMSSCISKSNCPNACFILAKPVFLLASKNPKTH